MRFLASLAGLLSLAAIIPSSFADKKTTKFTSLAASSKTYNGVIKLNDDLYDELTTAPRNYTAVVLLTALEARYGCQLCREFQPEYELLGKSWISTHKDSDGLFFGELDFADARNTFQKLQLTTAPSLFVFPPTIGPHADISHIDSPIQFDFSQNGAPAETVARFISHHTPHNLLVRRPFNYFRLFIALGVSLVGVTFATVVFPLVKPLLYSRNVWAALSLIAVLLFTSGHMFNHIRHVPYVANDGHGGVSYIAGGFSNQFGLETQIIAVLYALLAFAVISLAMKVPRLDDPGRQRVAVILWNLVLLVAFSFLMNLFKQKNGAYPFFLPPMM